MRKVCEKTGIPEEEAIAALNQTLARWRNATPAARYSRTPMRSWHSRPALMSWKRW